MAKLNTSKDGVVAWFGQREVCSCLRVALSRGFNAQLEIGGQSHRLACDSICCRACVSTTICCSDVCQEQGPVFRHLSCNTASNRLDKNSINLLRPKILQPKKGILKYFRITVSHYSDFVNFNINIYYELTQI